MKKFKIFVFSVLSTLFLVSSPITLAQEIETGVIGQYDTYEQADKVAKENQFEDDTQIIDTQITEENHEYIIKEVSYSEIFYSKTLADLDVLRVKMQYTIQGYDIDYEDVITNVVTETKEEIVTFNSLMELQAYKTLQELAGYHVNIQIASLGFTTNISNEDCIDETFDNLLSLLGYLFQLSKDYNHFELHFENNSTTIEIDEDIVEYFDTYEQAYDYLMQLQMEYEVTDSEIIENEEITITEDICELFVSQDDIDEYLNSLKNEDYAISNISVKEVENINIDKVLCSDNINLNNDEISYTTISTLSNVLVSVVYDEKGKTTNGSLVIKSIIVNGEPISLFGNSINNNSSVVIEGTINYCTKYRFLICTESHSDTFKTTGILNKDKNAIDSDTIFSYQISSYNAVENTIEDNLIHIYNLKLTKTKTYFDTGYTLNAHIYNIERVTELRVYGKVSKINIVPLINTIITKNKDVNQYNAIVNASLKGTKTIYTVTYTKTLKDIDEDDDSNSIEIDDNTTNNVSNDIETDDNIIDITDNESTVDLVPMGNIDNAQIANNSSNPLTADNTNIYYLLFSISSSSLLLLIVLLKRNN